MDDVRGFFEHPSYPAHKQYEALRAYFYEGLSATQVAKRFGYSVASLYCYASAFVKQLASGKEVQTQFFAPSLVGRPRKQGGNEKDQLIIALRKKYLSVEDIKSILDAGQANLSQTYIYNLLKKEGFARLPRRTRHNKNETLSSAEVVAPKSLSIELQNEIVTSTHAGILCFLPYIVSLGLDRLIERSSFPQTSTLSKTNSILSFVALKLSHIIRYTSDDIWCMDRGLGLFAGLNVLPKASWFSSYSHRITRDMNIDFLRSLHQLWLDQGLLSDTANLDFVSIPYWGDNSHLENNWSGTRHQALSSILAALAHDPDSGIITYGDTTVRHENSANVAVEFLDFYKKSGGKDLKFLVFDSKFTTYQNLKKLDEHDIKFITIRRRGKNIVASLAQDNKHAWKTIRVPAAGGKYRQIKAQDQQIILRKYGGDIRQIAITGNGKIKPALIITNDFDISMERIVRKYARRWLIEKTISEQTHFFHLNKVSSSMVIKVDFDLTMTILSHNLYRLLAMDLIGYEHATSNTLYEKFICNNGNVTVENGNIAVALKKKRNLPALMTAMKNFGAIKVPWLNDFNLNICAASNT